MIIPFPSLSKIEDQEEAGLPMAALLMAAIEMLSHTGDLMGRTHQHIYEEIKEKAR